MSWWARNAEQQGAAPGAADDFYSASYERSASQAAPTSDTRTGETAQPDTRPARGWPFGRPASS
ncbi:hypothetical protein ACWEPB_02660 [Kitasatospora cineracea]